MNCIAAVYLIAGGTLGLFDHVRLLGKINDEHQVFAEPGGAKTRHELLFLGFRFDPEKAQRLVLSRPAQGQYVEITQSGAKLVDRGSQARNVLAPS